MRVNADNRLYGGQVGGQYHLKSEFLTFAPQIKTGILGNANSTSTLVQDLNNTLTLRNVSNTSSTTSFLGELRLPGEVILTDSCRFNFGYNFLWVTDLAQAPRQLDFTDTSTSSQFVNDSHSVFFHGASLGITLTR
jgi:hypothetical protein